MYCYRAMHCTHDVTHTHTHTHVQQGRTALMLACEAEREAAAAELMEATKRAGALDLLGGSFYEDDPDKHLCRVSALHLASEKGLAGTVAKLLALNADAALTDQDGRTALMLACENTHEAGGLAAAAELMEATKRAGALDLQTEADYTAGCKQSALHLASEQGLAGTVAKLLALGADAALTDSGGKTPLDYAKADDVKAALREHGGKHSLFYAAEEGMPELVAELIEEGADVLGKDKDGKTVLDYAETEEVKAAFAEHSFLAAILLDRKEQVAGHIAKGADLAACDDLGRTALLLACAHGHEAAAALLVDPTMATDALDAVGDDGFSALLWAEEHGLRSVAQRLRECGAAAVRRPALSLFRGDPAKVQIKVAERTVAFVTHSTDSIMCVRSANRCPRGRKGYFELEILEIEERSRQRYGFATAAFVHVFGASDKGLGDDNQSWVVNGMAQVASHNADDKEYKCDRWKVGDVIGLACDLTSMQMHVSVNGSFVAPNGVVFELNPDSAGDSLFAAFSGSSGKVRYNFGEAPFQHAPPAADYQAFAAFEA